MFTTSKFKSWTVKYDRKQLISLDYAVGGPLCKCAGRPVLEHIVTETSLEAKMTTLKLSYFVYIMRRQDSLEKTIC